MKQTLSSTFILLVALTIFATFSMFNFSSEIMIKIIILLAVIKFWLVAFQFMELKKAHSFWKYLIVIFGSLVAIILILIL